MKRIFLIGFFLAVMLPVRLHAQISYQSHAVFCTGLNVPNQIVFDTSGNLFVANHSYASYSGPFTNTIAKIDPAGNKTVFLGGYTWPSGLAIDNQQNLYMTQNNASSNITRITPGGSAATFASLPHSPGPVTLFDNNVSAQFAVYTVSHWGIKGVQKTLFNGSHSEFATGSFHGCQLSSDGQYLYVFNSSTYEMFRFNAATGISEPWVTIIQNYEIWAGTIGPDGKLYVIARSLCDNTKKAVYRINGYNEVTEVITGFPGAHEFNDLAFKQNGPGWDLYVSEVAAGGRQDPLSNRIIKFSNVPMGGGMTPNVSLTASANPVCQGDTVTFTAQRGCGVSGGSFQWYVNGIPVTGGSVPGDGLVAWYPFNGNASDLSGYGNHGIVTGATLANDRFGDAGKAYYFDGINDFIKVNTSPSLDIKHGLTLAAWFRADPSNLSGQTQITWRGDPQGGYDPYSLCFTGGNLAFRRDVSPGNTMNQIVFPASGVNLSEWHHAAGTYDSATGVMKLYLDGVLKAQQTLPGTASYPTGTFWNMIGGVDNGYGQNFKGTLDDVRIYRRTLTSFEISSLSQNFDTTFSYVPQNGDTVYCVYTSSGSPAVTDTSNLIIMQVNDLPADIGESTGMASLQNGLVAYYPFNGNANDESGNGHTGVVHGASITTDRFGIENRAFLFNGNSDWIEGTSFSLTMPSVSQCVWVYSYGKTTNSSPQILGIYPSYSEHLMQIEVHYPGKEIFYNALSNYYLTTPSQVFSDSSWHFIVTVYNGSTYKIFYDGALVSESIATGIHAFNNQNLYIGRQLHQQAEYWNGKIDDIRIYDRELSSEEVLFLHNGSGNILKVELESDTLCLGADTYLHIQNSQPGIQYQLLKNSMNLGPPQTGNGDTLTFPISGLTTTSNFTIHALNPATGCNRMLDTTLNVTVVTFVTATSPDTSVCSGSNVVLQAFGGTNYLWSNGMTGAQITVAPLATATYYVTVTSAEGCSGLDSVLVTVLPGPTPTLSGPGTICLGTNNAAYTTETGKSNYTWMITGGIITAGAGTPTVTVTWNTLGTQSIAVNYANAQGCMAANATSLAVTVNPMAAPVITGSNSMCVNSGYYYYSTQTGMNNYQWSVSPGATIIWGLGTPDLIVTWDQPGAQWVSVNYTNSSGCTAITPTQLNVTVNPLPGVAGTITGPATVCAGSNGVAFSTTLISNAATYVWSLPPGASVASGAGTNAITVDFSTTAQPGSITVYGNNLCGNGSVSSPLTISVGALPGLAGIPVGLDDVCEGDTGIVYYIPPVFNAASYVWDIQGGGVITAGNGTNSIRAKFPVAPAECQITVYGTNACGQGQISPVKVVTVNPTPETPTITQNGDMLVSSAPDGNQWYFNGSPIPGATQQTLLPDQSGEYMVVVILSGCISEKSDGFYYIMTGMESPSQVQVSVYPVPNDGRFRVTCTGMKNEPTRIAIVNALGVTIDQREALSLLGEYQSEFDLRPVVPGVYTMVIENSSSRITRKLIIQ